MQTVECQHSPQIYHAQYHVARSEARSSYAYTRCGNICLETGALQLCMRRIQFGYHRSDWRLMSGDAEKGRLYGGTYVRLNVYAEVNAGWQKCRERRAQIHMYVDISLARYMHIYMHMKMVWGHAAAAQNQDDRRLDVKVTGISLSSRQINPTTIYDLYITCFEKI